MYVCTVNEPFVGRVIFTQDWNVGGVACIQFHAINLQAVKSVSFKNIVRNLSASGSGKRSCRHGFGSIDKGEPM